MSNKRELTLTTAINPELLQNIYSDTSETIVEIVVLTVDYKPVELSLKLPFDQKQRISDIIMVYDVAALVVRYKDSKSSTSEIKTKFVMAEDVMRVSNKVGDLVILNGKFDIIPNDSLVEVFKNFSDLKTVNLEELEDMLQISKNQSALKAYNQLSNYFSIENYSKNNNVFKLLQHQNDVVKISKQVLLKSIVAWEVRK